MTTYAKDTSVPVERSKREIELMLYKHGARNFLIGSTDGRAVVTFQLDNWRVQFDVPLPTAEEFSTTERRGRKVKATPQQVDNAVSQAERQRWRALSLAIKARLISVETGIETMQEAFLAHVVVPGGRRFFLEAHAAIDKAYLDGRVPKMLTAGEEFRP